MAWDYLVDKTDLSRTQLRDAPDPDPSGLADGEVLLAVESFSLTANNITYGVVGDRLGYWRFFPAPEPWGRIPVWGFARVIASRVASVDEGLRLYGYWPMSTHFNAQLVPAGSSYVDAAPHRAELPAAYNRYDAAPESPYDDHLALLRPLFTTSFLLDDYLAEVAPDATPILSSASSRTAIGLAWMLAQRGRPAIALTSARNAAFVERLDLYGAVVPYDAVDTLDVAGAAAFIDMAGDAGLRGDVHRALGDRLEVSTVVGATHYEAPPAEALPSGPRPSFFFAPDRLAARRRDWGGAVLNDRITTAMTGFIAASSWLQVERHSGPQALDAVFHTVRTGAASPEHGHIVMPAA